MHSRRTSVLINNYNNGPYLRYCVESVLKQTRPVDEIIVYDDGSTDNSLEILRSFGEKIKVIAGERGKGTDQQNQANAIAKAFEASSGELIFLLDGDDAFLPAKVERFTSEWAEEVVMMQSPMEKIDRSGSHIGYEYESARHRSDYRQHIYERLDLNIFYPTSALAFSRKYLQLRLPLESETRFNLWPDARLAIIAPLYGRVIAFNEFYTQWRRHPKAWNLRTQPVVYHLMRRNYGYFNVYCQRHGFPRIRLYLSFAHWTRALKFYAQVVINKRLVEMIRWSLMTKKHRKELENPPIPSMGARADEGSIP